MDLFKGVFVSKRIGAIRFIPLLKMTNEDWAILDYDFIRTVAKNRIAEMAASGDLVGFFLVDTFQKRNKTRWMQPASKAQVEKVSAQDEIDAEDIDFGHAAEAEELTELAEQLEDQAFRLGMIPPAAVLAALLKALKESDSELEEPEDEDEESQLAYEEAKAELENKYFDMLAIIKFWQHKSPPETEAILLELEEALEDAQV